MSAASFLNSSFLQAINAVKLRPVHVQKIPQASEHLCPAKLQTRCDICCACQSICPFIPTDTGVQRRRWIQQHHYYNRPDAQYLLPRRETASLAWWLRRLPRERKVPGSNPACAGIFPGSSHTSDSKIGTAVATLPGAWRYRVSAGTGRPGVSIL